MKQREAPPLNLDSRTLSDLAPKVRFWKGSCIGAQGEPCENIYIISEGQVLLSRRDAHGDDYALYLLGSGDLFGEGSLAGTRRWLVTARAITDGSAHVLPAAQIPRFAQYYPQLTAHLVTLLSARLERAHIRLDIVTTDSARERLLGILNVLADYHGEVRDGSRWLPLRLTQAELGGMVGLARETVARVMGDLESEGLIRRHGRRGLWLADMPHGEP
ncbi:MAG: Crp/Fnr family transcriptional regulator [Actinomycetota bacterium]